MTGAAVRAEARKHEQRAAWSLAVLDLRLVWRGGLILVLLIAGLSAVVVLQYAVTFADPRAVGTLEVLAENPAIRVLFGVPRALEDPGGFTVWRTGMFAAIAAGAWALAVTTRLTRGEEERGHAWLILSGSVDVRRALFVHLVVVGAILIGLAVALAAGMVASGAGATGATVHAAGVGLTGLWFAVLGTLSGQLIGNRRAASGSAAGVLLLAMMARMLADGITALGWLSWFTPFGLLSLSAPYALDRRLPLLVLLAHIAMLVWLAWLAAGRRDVGAGLWSGATINSRKTQRRQPLLLSSLVAFTVRRTLGPVAGWSAALVGYYFLIGLLAVSLTDFLRDNPLFADLAAQAGFGNLATVTGYAASLIMLLPIPLGLFAAVRIGAAAEDEQQRRLTPVLALPIGRLRWAATETLGVCAACLLITVLTAGAVWAGVVSAGASLGAGQALAGTLNVLPVALLSLGAAVLALGHLPRAVVAVGSVPVIGGFVLWVLADTLNWPNWVGRLSPFEHIAAVPAESPDWTGALVMVTVAGGLIVLGLAGFVRRDLRG